MSDMIKQSMVTPDKAHSPKRSNRSDMASSQLDLARAYVSAGVSVIPLKTDGTKAPALASWNEYRKRFAADDELRRWFRRPAGIGLVCGVQSNGLEVLDFDEDPVETMLEWAKILPEGLLDRLTIVATGGGGFHVPYRCESVTGNTKIAMAAEGGVLIESRGDGGYVVGVGSATGVHSSGKSYWQTAGEPLPSLPTVSADERKLMWMAAAELDERPDAADEFVRKRRAQLRPQTKPDSDTPWGAFDESADWRQILESVGWTTTNGKHWTRAGKTFGTSAALGTAKNGNEILTVFSTNAGELSAEGTGHRNWGKFAAYAALHHEGDRSAAAKAVLAMGFGRAAR